MILKEDLKKNKKRKFRILNSKNIQEKYQWITEIIPKPIKRSIWGDEGIRKKILKKN